MNPEGEELYTQESENSHSNSGRQSLRLPAELFKTSEKYYIFDPNQVNFLEVNEIIFEIISILKHTPKNLHALAEALPGYPVRDIRDALGEIEEIQSQGYFKPHDFQRANPYTIADIKKYLTTSNRESVYFNITSKCNLSCAYCIFGGDYANQDEMNQQQMTWDTAQKAMDFFLPQIRKDGQLRLDFFGGEPLLAFPLMKRIVNSMTKKMHQRNQELMVAVTSNGTVLNEEIIDFLIRHNVLFQISIDGEKEIHDANRKFKNSNTGTFDTIMKNLQRIYDRDADYFLDRVRLKAVTTTEFFDSPETGFFSIPLIKKLRDHKRFSVLDKTPHYKLNKDRDFFARIHKLGESLLQKKDVSTIKELLNGLNFKKKDLFYMTFYEFFLIQVINSTRFDLNDPVPFIKDCMIGIEGCVNPDGSISVCYKSGTFIIGNVLENTWYFDKIAEFHKKRYSWTGCKNCFVQRFCMLCYEKLNGKEDQLKASIQSFCEFNRNYYRLIFEYMLKILEKNPDLWNEPQRLAEKQQEILKSKGETT